MAAEGNLTRRASMFLRMQSKPVEEIEFFSPENGSANTSSTQDSASREMTRPSTKKPISLATVASREVLLTSLLGDLSFSDPQLERDWQRYEASACRALGLDARS